MQVQDFPQFLARCVAEKYAPGLRDVAWSLEQALHAQLDAERALAQLREVIAAQAGPEPASGPLGALLAHCDAEDAAPAGDGFLDLQVRPCGQATQPRPHAPTPACSSARHSPVR